MMTHAFYPNKAEDLLCLLSGIPCRKKLFQLGSDCPITIPCVPFLECDRLNLWQPPPLIKTVKVLDPIHKKLDRENCHPSQVSTTNVTCSTLDIDIRVSSSRDCSHIG